MPMRRTPRETAMLHQIAAPFILLFLVVVFCPRLAFGIGAGLLLIPRFMAGLAVVGGIFVVASVLAHG